MVVLFPESVVDAEGETKPTGQRLVVTNSGDMRHEAKLSGSSRRNPTRAEFLDPKLGDKVEEATFRPHADPDVLTLTCDFHRWMRASVWAFEHPFAAVTGSDGRYEIANAPAGAAVEVLAWHEAGDAERTRLTVPAGGEVVADFVVTPR